jgi:hypothetical protein
MWSGLGLSPAGTEVELSSPNRPLLERHLLDMQRQVNGPQDFLTAWKRAVKLSAGPSFFTCEQGYEPAASVEAATSKWQMIPDWEACKKGMGYLSAGEALFLAAMVAFYNDELGEECARRAGESLNPRILATRLDEPHAQAITHLMLTYRGW